jgi:hypothetical protein
MNHGYEMPPLVSDGETVATDEQAFIEVCKAAFAADAQQFQWVYGKSLLTRSQRWGLVWRCDFFVAGRRGSLVNRAMCWGGAGVVEGQVVAFGQRIPPLD